MHILILSQWYPPEPVLLIQELAQTLQEMGHVVTVLTGFPNYPSGKLYPGYRIRFWQRETIAGVKIVRVPLYPDHSKSGVRRILNYLSFALSASLLGALLVTKPDVIFVYHPPLTVGIPAKFLGMLWRIPFVYQIQDMWPETLQATGMLNNASIVRWVGGFAKWVYKQAAALCVISPGFRQNLLAKGVPDNKIHMISNWVDPEVYHPAPPNPAKAEQLGLVGSFNIMFAGNIGEAQGLKTVLEAAACLQDLPCVQFVFVGDGVALPELKRLAAEGGLCNVRFLGRRPSDEMTDLYALADVLLVHLKDEPLFRITIPHKIFAYMASGKPILAAVAGDAADLIATKNAGITCAPENPEALAVAVRKLYNMSESERNRLGSNGLQTACTEYNRTALVAQIEALLSSLC